MFTTKHFFLICILLCLGFLISCDNGNSNQEGNFETVKVTFFNDSSYKVNVHRGSFYGPIIAEVNTSDRETTVSVRPSEDNSGTVFSIVYLIYPLNDDIKNDEIFVSCHDNNVQIKEVIRAGEPCTIKIPQPANLVCKSAFIKIINAHNLPIELRYAGRVIAQEPDKIIPIAPNRQGTFKLDGIPDEGEYCQYYNIAATFEITYFSDFVSKNGSFIAKNAYIYFFTFDGNSIAKTGEQKIVF